MRVLSNTAQSVTLIYNGIVKLRVNKRRIPLKTACLKILYIHHDSAEFQMFLKSQDPHFKIVISTKMGTCFFLDEVILRNLNKQYIKN